jgi:hypothetical protein
MFAYEMVLIHRGKRKVHQPTRNNDVPLFVVLAGTWNDRLRVLDELDKQKVPYSTSTYTHERHYSRVINLWVLALFELPPYGVFIVWLKEDTQIIQFDPDQIVIRGTKGLGGLLVYCHFRMKKDKRV